MTRSGERGQAGRWLAALALLAAGGPAWAAEPAPTQPEPGRRTVAVMYFQNNALLNREALAPLEKGLADMLITELSKIEAMKVVERAQLQQLMREMGLGASGAVTAETAQQMGRLLGAEILLLGSFSTDPSGEKTRIDARLVETETGLTLKAEEITGKTSSLLAMVRKLTRKIAKELDVRVTAADDERLASAGNESFEATVLYSKGLGLEDAEDWQGALGMYRQALELNPEYAKAKQRIAAIEQRLAAP